MDNVGTLVADGAGSVSILTEIAEVAVVAQGGLNAFFRPG